jgi:methylenetetrahydrofolate reductase (NADPH)
MTANAHDMGDSSLHSEMAERLQRRPWPATPLNPGVDVSFEFFPPAGPKGAATLPACAERLAGLHPRFVSVTYGAGGSTQDRTFDTLESLSALGLDLTGHVTCVGATAAEIDEVLDRYRDLGVRRLVALRGDAPEEGGSGAVEGGHVDAAALVEAVRARPDGGDWDISVAGYPEVHPRAQSAQADLESLRRKVDAGADRVLTQFFFDNEAFLRFHETARAAGVSVPIVPGIMPIGSFERVAAFAARCGTVVPEWMPQLFDGLDQEPDVHQLVAATVAAEQCRHLAEHGIRDFHFYTMNRAELTEATCRMLGVKVSGACSKGAAAS